MKYALNLTNIFLVNAWVQIEKLFVVNVQRAEQNIPLRVNIKTFIAKLKRTFGADVLIAVKKGECEYAV